MWRGMADDVELVRWDSGCAGTARRAGAGARGAETLETLEMPETPAGTVEAVVRLFPPRTAEPKFRFTRRIPVIYGSSKHSGAERDVWGFSPTTGNLLAL